MKVDESGWKGMKGDELEWKGIKGDKSGWTCMKVDKTGWKLMKVDESSAANSSYELIFLKIWAKHEHLFYKNLSKIQVKLKFLF